jgi:hypothetical protein
MGSTNPPTEKERFEMNLAKIREAVKSAPSHCVIIGDLRVEGWPGRLKWEFGYVVNTTLENGKKRVAYGPNNAVRYLGTLPKDTPIVIDTRPVGGR